MEIERIEALQLDSYGRFNDDANVSPK